VHSPSDVAALPKDRAASYTFDFVMGAQKMDPDFGVAVANSVR